MNFTDLNLPSEILQALKEQGYETPTPIQEKAIPPALQGRDVLGCAQTGTGKTCAFAVPILIRLDREHLKNHPIRALVLTPTRELAIQNQDCFVAYGAHLPLRSTVIFGGVGQGPQVEALEKGTDILVATPGRLADLYQQGHIDLSALEIFVLDEADRMLDMGFIHDVKKILKWLPEKKQTLFFSATMPKEVRSLVDGLLHDPVRIAVDPVNSTVDAIDQSLYRTDKSKKIKLLTWLLEQRDYPSVLVFTRTKHGANRVARDLERAGISAAAIHGNKSQTARQAALADFKAGKLRVLVATDIAARGLDIEALSCVVSYNLPDVPETYVHRIGRTGRAGLDGVAISFCDASELEELAAIEKQLGRRIPEVSQHPYPMEEMEVAVTDQKGRKINPEDAEAREAAREQSKKRRESREKAPAAAPAVQPRAEKSGKGKPSAGKPQNQEAAPAPAKAAQNQKKSALSEELVLRPEEDVGDYSDLIRHRATSRPASRKPYSAAALDELLALPDFADELGYDRLEQTQRKGPLAGGRVMDATARMFLKGKTEEEPSVRQETRRSHRRGQDNASPKKAEGPSARQEKPSKQPKQAKQEKQQPQQAQESRKDSRQQAAQPSRRQRRSSGKGQSAQAPQPRAAAVLEQSRPRNSRPNSPGGKGKRRTDAPAEKAPATENKSLVRPYYLTDTRGKRG
ncbi:MAG: DEAD/DEAH box helicase [Clostridiales bacterium]|nr:DEAD/DEAH box helicase [Clostridiales bacterium]